MINFIGLAKEAHKNVCPMLNCVDCLFGMCDAECDYQKRYEKELESLLIMKEMIINEPCNECKSSQCLVDINNEGWMKIICIKCMKVIAEGYAQSPWELLKK